jgi:hypothetical protein
VKITDITLPAGGFQSSEGSGEEYGLFLSADPPGSGILALLRFGLLGPPASNDTSVPWEWPEEPTLKRSL